MLPVQNAKILKFDYRGAPQTVDVMRKAALDAQGNMSVRRLAEAVCQGIDSKDYSSEYLALYNFVLQRCRYMRDPRTVELVRSPDVLCEEILQGGRPACDCDDEACLLAALILAVGGNARIVTVAFHNNFYRGQRQYSHVFTQALEPRTNTWIVLDPVAAEKTGEMLARVKAARIFPVA